MLKENQIDIWLTRPKKIQDIELLEYYRTLMSDDEETRYQRFLFERHKHAFSVTRALIRTVLSRYIALAPTDWSFSKNEYGRPFITNPGLPYALQFNISHTGEYIVCVINRSFEAGLDVENTERVNDPLQLAEHFFSPFEIQQLYALPTLKQRDRFFAYWTLGEAYIKARGMGLAIPLHYFTYHLERDGTIEISFDPAWEDQASRWSFGLWRLDPHHLMALALPTREVQLASITMCEIVPCTQQDRLYSPQLLAHSFRVD